MSGSVGYLSDFLLFAGCVAVAMVFALLAGLYTRVSQTKKAERNDTVLNLTEIAILFQAMRSVLHDQKTLARDFNANVEQKAGMIRQVLQQVVEAADQLAKTQARLAQQLDRVEKRAALLERRAAEHASAPDSPPDEPEPLALQIIAAPEESAVMANLLEGWKAFDMPAGEKISEETFDVPQETPEAPRDPERARAAFRALLNMTEDSAETGNGGRKAEALRARVHEYHDAGMSVAQIAQELGVGKGEIRLMLTLREKREQPNA